MSTDDDLVRGALSRSPLAAAGPCPDENVLLAWAAGSLEGTAATALVSHLAACDACRDILGDLRLALVSDTPAPEVADEQEGVGEKKASIGGAAGAGPSAGPPTSGGRVLSGPGSRWGAIAAAVLLVAGAGVFFAMRGRPAGTPSSGVAAAYRDVASAAGAPYTSQAALTDEELARGLPVDTVRGGLVVLRPRGVVFGTQPYIAWTAVPGATSYAVTVRSAEGVVLWRTDAGTRLGIPSDAAALGAASGEARVVEVVAEGALGRTTARATFTFATPDELAALERARALASELSPGVGRTALGHLAARAGWWEQALMLAEGAPDRRTPGTPAHAFATFVRKSLGLPLTGDVPHGDR